MKVKKVCFLAISVGIIYLWFGMLKFFPHMSPAEELARNTIKTLTFGLISPGLGIKLLAIWESAIGLMLLLHIYKKLAVSLAIVHIILTFSPLFLFPEQIFSHGPFSLSFTGQYIIKNIIILNVLIVLAQSGYAAFPRIKIRKFVSYYCIPAGIKAYYFQERER
ncbi:MAG: doxx family protein [Gillisia sp.]